MCSLISESPELVDFAVEVADMARLQCEVLVVFFMLLFLLRLSFFRKNGTALAYKSAKALTPIVNSRKKECGNG